MSASAGRIRGGEAIGIDLGTTYSCVGVWQHDHVVIVANEMGNRTTPSYVSFSDSDRLVGDSAKNRTSMNPSNSVYDSKRLIGRKFDDAVVQADIKLWPFKVVRGASNKPLIEIDHKGEKKRFCAEEISAMVLGKLKVVAEGFLGKEVKEAVVTVPAYFNDSQRMATKDAGTIAGLKILRIINEPTAAAIAYGLDLKGGMQNVLIFDLGGGTFDVSLLKIEDGIFEVLATAGDTHLGGADFDNSLVEHCMAEFKKKHAKDLQDDQKAKHRLRNACERAKRMLSEMPEAFVEVDSLHDGIDFRITITRAKFEELCSDFFSNTLLPVAQVLSDARMAKGLVNEVVLVGGSSRIPKVQQLLKDFFDGKELCKTVNVDEAVAYGATVLAAQLGGFDTSGKLEALFLLDVTPLSLGMDTIGGVFESIIARNTAIPTTKTKAFTTTRDDQTSLSISILEGERALSKDNQLLGHFDLMGIPPMPRGVPSVEVTFEIDANGILDVVAIEKTMGRSNRITISNEKARLSAEDISRMVAEGVRFKIEDDAAIKKIAARNALERYAFDARCKIRDTRVTRLLTDAERATIETAVDGALRWLEEHGGAEKDEFKERQRQLELSIMSLMQKLAAGRASIVGPKFTEVD